MYVKQEKEAENVIGKDEGTNEEEDKKIDEELKWEMLDEDIKKEDEAAAARGEVLEAGQKRRISDIEDSGLDVDEYSKNLDSNIKSLEDEI